MRTTLVEYAAVYIRLEDGSRGYYDQFRWMISRIEKHYGRTLFVDEFSEDLVNDYLAHNRENLSSFTRSNRRNMLLRLWRHAATNPALKTKPPLPNRDLIAKVKRRQRPPRAWSLAEVQQLLSVAAALSGAYMGGIPKALYWTAWILAVWSTGLRRCDLMSLKREDIPKSGRVVIVQRKTGKHVVGQFNADSIAAIDALCKAHNQPYIFPLWCRLSGWRKIARKLVKRAALSMSIGKLRHSAGTNVENRNPGHGHHFLGNTPQVFYQHYYDRSHVDELPGPQSLR